MQIIEITYLQLTTLNQQKILYIENKTKSLHDDENKDTTLERGLIFKELITESTTLKIEN